MSLLKVLLALNKLQNNAKKSRSAIESLQEKKFRKLLAFTYRHSAFYRDYWREHEIEENQLKTIALNRLPVIDKKTLIENFARLNTISVTQEELAAFDASQSEGKFKGKYAVVHSSGSTSKPCYFIYDKKGWDYLIAGILRAALWDLSLGQVIGLVKKGSRILYVAASDGNYGGALAAKDGISGLNSKEFCLDIKTPIAEWKDTIVKADPNLIIGYPSAIKILCEVVKTEKIDLRLDRVVTCGEPLGAGMKNYFEAVLHSEVVNIYGTSESVALGVESKNTDGIVLFDDMNIVEVQSDGIYLTNLYNKAMPLVRYKISDILTEKNISPRYPFSRVGNILGRNEDVLWFEADGRKEFLHPLSIEGFCIEGLIDYQFVQKSASSFEVRIQIDKCDGSVIKSELKKEIDAVLSEKKLDFVSYELVEVAEIYPDQKTGKKKLVVVSSWNFF